MRARHALVALGLSALVVAHPAASQTVDDLIAAGRFDEAAALVGRASPEAAQVADRIFQQAYTGGHQRQDFEYAIRGYAAAKRLIDMSDPAYDRLSFWHGFALYNQAIEAQMPQSLESAQVALPMFEEARGLLVAAGTYPGTIDVNMTQLLEATDTYIQIQNAVIRRGN
jgi:hypothetical protein